ncbi:hypothetical protein GCM10007937_43130 [Mesorhizobium albiziae]|nr:hypothetical protein GCM10007937_43130 [Mesorhizobium albiziae]
MQRGIPTAFAAPVLKNALISAGSYIYVWPYASGHDMGQSVTPLFKSVPESVQKDDRLYEYLALADAIRLGNQREAGLAAERLSEGLRRNDQHPRPAACNAKGCRGSAGRHLRNRLVFVGGCTTALFITDSVTLENVRATDDVDLIVDLAGFSEWAQLPGGGLALGAARGGGRRQQDRARRRCRFVAAGIAARTSGKVLWCVTQQDLFAPVAHQAGLPPSRVIHVEAGDEKTVLGMEEGRQSARARPVYNSR